MNFLATTLEFSSSVFSHNFSVSILTDQTIEMEEFFDIVITDVSINNGFGVVNLSDEEYSRIITESHARILIQDSKFKFTGASMAKAEYALF